ncbi:Hpt domain-containing protein [Ruegeria marina]|uniref:HPt (Histidine-containing phosphotransfer) domain-containing protein n=1 Tax=Ruegeria marina TaxID=639004 RepID=A0A1G6VPE0_9RHOB|nr:Hpt domain-containing protein [Ruegeria marina]SDD54735.1 HPt (histidine-containing phosphotransfer) domain-containing protein [Ruegeria marina]
MENADIDLAALKRLLEVVGGDVEELEDLRNDYFEDAPELVRRILDAAGRADLTALKIAAHTLKSNARDFGAARLAELCAVLERTCLEGGPEDPVGLARRIRDEEDLARRALAGLNLGDLEGPRSER